MAMPPASLVLSGGDLQSLPQNISDADEKICEYYRDFFHEIYIFVHRYSHDDEEAQDLAQDVFAKALKYLRRANEKISNPRAWLYRIAKTHCIDRVFRKKKIIATELKPDLIAAENPNGSFEESILDQAMVDSVLEWVSENSSETEQQIFELKIIRGLSQAEIGEIMHCHASTISRILNGMIEQIVRRFA
jgi:RNA polymerase sigma factor (sigma-70 family)